MSYRLRIVDDAKAELRDEAAYSKRQWGDAHGKAYMRDLKARIDTLKDNPKLYALRDDLCEGVRLLSYKGHNIVYWVDDAKGDVVILCIRSVYKAIDAELLNPRHTP